MPDPSPSQGSDVPAATLGPYRIERRLGAGGMGEVYLAFDDRLDRRVALKRLRRDRPEDRQRLHREARALAKLHHSSIVQCFDLLVLDDEEWLVLEYIEGPRLTDLLADGPLPADRVVEYGRQVAEGLQVAHLNGILHRDLKSENVVVDRATDRAKILDFGLVRRVAEQPEDSESLTASGALVGTLRAVAPEQALGLDVGPRTDLFSLGVLLHEMLTGRSPFRADSPTATLGRVLSQPPEPLPPEVPDDLAELVARLLEKPPEQRPRDAAEVAQRLGQIATSLASTGQHQSKQSQPASRSAKSNADLDDTTLDASMPTPPTSMPQKSAPWRWFGLGVVVVLAVGALFSLRWLPGSEPPQSIDAGSTGVGPTAPIDTSPTGSVLSAEAGWEALAAFDRGQVRRAIETFQARLEANPDSADDHSGLARAYWRRFYETSGDGMWLEQGEAIARQAVDLARDPSEEARARTSLGLVLIERGEIAAARVEIETALALDATDADTHRGLAEVLQASSAHPEAEASLRRALTLRPDDRDLHDLLGSHLFRLGRLDEAEAAFRRSIALAPDAVAGHSNLAAVLITRGDLDEAVTVLERALTIRPTANLHLNLGTVYFFQGLYSRAADAYEKALESTYGVHQPVTWANLGDAYRQIPQRRHEAPAAFRQAVRLLETRLAESGAQDTSRLSQLALYQAKAGLATEARETLDGLRVTDPRALLRVVTAWEILGGRDEALASLGAAFEAGLDPQEVQRDPELLALRSDRRFHELLEPRDTGSPTP